MTRFFRLASALFAIASFGSTLTAEEVPPFQIQSVHDVELGMPLSEAAYVLESEGFTRYRSRDVCLEGTQDRTVCQRTEVIAGSTQRGKRVTWVAQRATTFKKNEISVTLLYSSAENGALVYGIERTEKFGRGVVKYPPVRAQIFERAGPAIEQRPLCGGGSSFSFLLDGNWGYVSATRRGNGWTPELLTPPSLCGNIAWSPTNGRIHQNAAWMLDQAEGSAKYLTKVDFQLGAFNKTISRFYFGIYDNEIAAQSVMSEYLVAVEELTPEKSLSSDF
jgi:hypothetical protein